MKRQEKTLCESGNTKKDIKRIVEDDLQEKLLKEYISLLKEQNKKQGILSSKRMQGAEFFYIDDKRVTFIYDIHLG